MSPSFSINIPLQNYVQGLRARKARPLCTDSRPAYGQQGGQTVMEPRLRFNLDQLLKQNNLRASDLSKITGIPKQTISEWRSGLVPKSVVALKRVASAFGVSLDELVFRVFGPEASMNDGAVHDLQRTSSSAQALRFLEEQGLTSDFLIAFNRQGYYSFLSESWAQCLAWDRAQLLSRPVIEFMALGTTAPGELVSRFFQDEGSMSQMQCSFLAHDLRVIPFTWQKIPIRSEQTTLCLAQLDLSQPPSLDGLSSFPLAESIQKAVAAFQAQPWARNVSWRIESSELPVLVHNRQHTFVQTLMACLNNVALALVEKGQIAATTPLLQWQVQDQRVIIRLSTLDSMLPEEHRLLQFPSQLVHHLGGQVRLQEWGPVNSLTLEIPLENVTL
jgi:transcriptional regulator with XRE-family HTH domain